MAGTWPWCHGPPCPTGRQGLYLLQVSALPPGSVTHAAIFVRSQRLTAASVTKATCHPGNNVAQWRGR
jgi:hypothetical protein